MKATLDSSQKRLRWLVSIPFAGLAILMLMLHIFTEWAGEALLEVADRIQGE